MSPGRRADIDEEVVHEIERFIAERRDEEAVFNRVLATVLFSDVVGSTQKAVELGGRAWRELLERHNAIVRAALGRYRGVEISTAGDGFFATIDGEAGGLGVVIGARIGALAGASEVLISQTVRGSRRGIGARVRRRGEHALKGVPDTWRVYRVVHAE